MSTKGECARCGEITDIPDGYEVCEPCAATINTAGEHAELFAPQAAEDAEKRKPDWAK